MFSAGNVARPVPVAQGRPGPPLTLPADKGRMSNARFTRDGRWLVAYNHDQRVATVWSMELRVLLDLACRTAGRQFDDEERRLYGTGERAVCAAPRRAEAQPTFAGGGPGHDLIFANDRLPASKSGVARPLTCGWTGCHVDFR